MPTLDPFNEAIDRYRTQGRWTHGWAKGKLRGDPAYRAALDRLPTAGRLLDIGCGEGYLLALAATARPGLTLIGLDHDERRLDIARTALADLVRSGRAELSKADAAEVAFPEADAVALLDVLHYLPIQEQDHLIARAAGALRPGGLLLIRDAEPDRSPRSFVTKAAERLARLTGRHRGRGLFFRSLDDTAAACRAGGLTTELTDCDEGTPFRNRLLSARRPPAPAPDAAPIG